MEKQKMTIHRGLAELKLIDAKITKQTAEVLPSGMYQKGKLINGYFTEDAFKEQAQSKYQSVVDLIARKGLIKSAIVNANGVTSVKVGEVTMTIADAINQKAAIKFKKELAAQLKRLHNANVGALNKNNEIVNQNLEILLQNLFGKEATKVDPKDLEAVRNPYLEGNTFHLFNPLDIDKKIEALEKEVSDFEMEVDAALSEVNATTFIEV